MASWTDFVEAAPTLAQIGRERFGAHDLVIIGTLRKDGWPRLAPIEYFFFERNLHFGGMWQSKKSLDLVRDPRV